MFWCLFYELQISISKGNFTPGGKKVAVFSAFSFCSSPLLNLTQTDQKSFGDE